MLKRGDLLKSIAKTTADYRENELPAPTPDHVDRWVKQFDSNVQLPILQEMSHVLKKTYFSKKRIKNFCARLIKHEALTGGNVRDFWSRSHLLDIQKNGQSQTQIRQLFGEVLLEQCELNLDECGVDGGAYIYLDDAIFTGTRVKVDLMDWIKNISPKVAEIHILVIATHKYGAWQCEEKLKKAADVAKKDIQFRIWKTMGIENRQSYRNNSGVLWPTCLPDDSAINTYMSKQINSRFLPRPAGGSPQINIFSSEMGRQLLECEFLKAGARIQGFSQAPNRSMHPLGFGPFDVGFGSTIVTYRNCPNNAPLALWWGDPNIQASHPFRKWYPLFQRKVYE